MDFNTNKVPPSKSTLQEINKKRWKHLGYRRFCEFVASDNDFFILRKFSTLTVRVLLALQDELSELESQLATLESQLSAKGAEDIHNGSFRQEASEQRLNIIHAIHTKLKEYHELVIQHSDLRSRPRVPKKDTTSLSNWFFNHKNAILTAETEYVQHERDLFAIAPKSKAPLRTFLERSSHFRFLRLWQKKKAGIAQDNEAAFSDENVHYSSDLRIDTFVTGIITVLGLLMLIVPLWILAFVSQMVYQLVIITLFVVVFLCFVSFTTSARPFESLGAAAAYAAVLVVFLQIAPS